MPLDLVVAERTRAHVHFGMTELLLVVIVVFVAVVSFVLRKIGSLLVLVG